jgi:hypothetical protein
LRPHPYINADMAVIDVVEAKLVTRSRRSSAARIGGPEAITSITLRQRIGYLCVQVISYEGAIACDREAGYAMGISSSSCSSLSARES